MDFKVKFKYTLKRIQLYTCLRYNYMVIDIPASKCKLHPNNYLAMTISSEKYYKMLRPIYYKYLQREYSFQSIYKGRNCLYVDFKDDFNEI